MKISRVVAVLMLVALSSCEKNTVYDKFERNFEEQRWQKTDVRTYEFEITQGATNYNMDIHFAHIFGYQFPSVLLLVTIENPDKTVTTKNITLEITDKNGKDNGDCAGDICDLYVNVFENLPLEVGKYKVTISHNFQGEYLPNILGFGIEVYASID
ncbi:gliding motility-associated lipoprotein GldH [Flavobacterium arsenatis]|uniref:Gliding motility-associated lipoprotein GldH n=1 Tax=Flavobacterium arsenatis TaxID=1484332 RepID=A0ABU1TT56_9FLAO|nr:hypothetical protein [Flavobacterium arsenatis]MDR6969002.1 gliding motility-associated lipoprotein GldH [Flavobacterium arsenatis]